MESRLVRTGQRLWACHDGLDAVDQVLPHFFSAPLFCICLCASDSMSACPSPLAARAGLKKREKMVKRLHRSSLKRAKCALHPSPGTLHRKVPRCELSPSPEHARARARVCASVSTLSASSSKGAVQATHTVLGARGAVQRARTRNQRQPCGAHL